MHLNQFELNEVSVEIQSQPIVQDVSFSLLDGQIGCLLGPSGSGKTTLLRAIAGFQSINAGSITVRGETVSDANAMKPAEKRCIGMMFQDLALFPHLSVGKNITYGLKMQGAATDVMQDREEHLLDMIGLAGFGSRPVASLSGGQKQRVAIARALALEPQLFLMDEPFSALDAGLREHLQVELKKIQQRLGVTTVFVTHDQSEAMALADRIVILNNGTVEQVGTPGEIYQQPASRFVAEFIGSNNLLDVDISADAIHYGNNKLGLPTAFSELRGPQILAIRPEAIELRSAGSDQFALQGTVITERAVGALIEREIDVAGSIFRQVSFQSTRQTPIQGDDVYLGWDWSQVWCIPG